MNYLLVMNTIFYCRYLLWFHLFIYSIFNLIIYIIHYKILFLKLNILLIDYLNENIRGVRDLKSTRIFIIQKKK